LYRGIYSDDKKCSMASRELGLLERYQLSKWATNIYTNVGLAVQLSVPLEASTQDDEQISQGLKQRLASSAKAACQLDHSATLFMSVEEENLAKGLHRKLETWLPNTPRATLLDKIDLSKVITVERHQGDLDTNAIERLTNEELHVHFDIPSDMPLWRIRVVWTKAKDGDNVVFWANWTFHHIIGDGMTSRLFWTAVLRELNTQATNAVVDNEFWIAKRAASQTLNPPFDKRGAPQPGVTDLIPVVLKHKILPESIKSILYPKTWSIPSDGMRNSLTPVDVDTACFTIDAEKTTWLVRKSKEENSGVHAIVYTIILKSLFNKIQSEQSAKTYLKADTPVNGRKSCRPEVPNTEMGNFVGSFSKLWKGDDIASIDIWELSRIYKAAMASGLSYAPKETMMLKYVGQWPKAWFEFWQKNAESARTSFELSDLGLWNDCPNTAPWKVEHAWFMQSVNSVGAIMNWNSITCSGIIHFTVTWQRDAPTKTFVEDVIDRVQHELTALIEQSS
jgi:hypothetical protein